jgi:hypothetical protein
MRIAIAGGNGFVGRALTARLLERGDEVVWLSHRPGRAAALGFPTVAEHAFDPAATDSAWAAAVRDADAVVNLSGHPIASRWSPRVKELLRSSRVDTNRALATVLARAAEDDPAHPRTLVTASGIGIYGDRSDEVLAEDAAPGRDWLAQLAVTWEAAADAGPAVRVAAVRTGITLGSEGFLPKMLLPMRLFAGGPVGSGRQYLAWIHLDDLTGIYDHVLHTGGISGPVNACAPGVVTMREFARALGRVTRRPSWFPVPAPMLRLVLGEVAPYTLFSQRASAERIQDAGYTFLHPEVEGALRDAVAGLRRS